MPLTGPDEVLRAISHDILEPLRTIGWYADKFCEQPSVTQSVDGVILVGDLLRIVTKSQKSFLEFYDSYKLSREVDFYRRYAQSILDGDIRDIGSATALALPYLKQVKFEDKGISVEEFRKVTSRLQIRYNGLLKYLELAGQTKRTLTSIANEAERVFDDLQAARERYGVSEENFSIVGNVTDLFDQMMIGLLIQNLLVNAFKFQRSDVQPAISLGLWTLRKTQLEPWLTPGVYKELGAMVPGDEVHLFLFEDNGIGIPSRFHERVFKAYVQVPKAKEYEGAGMGLAIVKTVVARHQGKVWIDSKEAKGTRFFIALPVTEALNASTKNLSLLREKLSRPLHRDK